MRSKPLCVLGALLLLAAAGQAQEMQVQVELMNGLSTSSSHKGDLVSARVLSPAALQGDIMEGKVANVEEGGGRAVLKFNFETLRHAGQAVSISSEIRSITNSKGQVDVDENGNAFRKSRGKGKSSGLAKAGGAIGGLLGSRKGAVVASTSNAAEAVMSIDLSSDAPNLTLAAGSKITLSARSRGGAELAGLAPSGSPATAQAQTATAPTATAQAAPASGQPDLTAVKVDFVPGDKIILYDDFSDMAADEPPPHWKVRGGTAELRQGGGVRQLTMTANSITMSPNVTSLPANFTMEADIAYKGHGARVWWRFHNKAGQGLLDIITDVNYAKFGLTIRVTNKGTTEELTTQQIPMDWTSPVKQALWLQNGRMRFYVNGQRVMDVNQIELPDLGRIEAYVNGPGGNDPQGYVGFRLFRVAESSPDFSKVLFSSGRYVTHGILFDTDSDRIKPESAPVLRMIAKGLEGDPALKLKIEGHTDSVGNADHNLDLSKRRAESVRAVLVSQFNIDGSRLTTAGLGASKPVDTNDTPQGRAQNRRVEFVKQ